MSNFNRLALPHTLRRWLYQNYRKVILISWLILLLTAYIVIGQTELDTKYVALQVLSILTTNWWGPLLLLLTYIIRPLVLLPISVFSVISGVVFGVWPGILLTFIGAVVSGIIAYILGRWLGRSLHFTNIVPKGPKVAERRPFEVVLGLHLTMLPYDVINYAVGVARIPFIPFLLGVVLGIIPGTISLTLLGASIDIETALADGISTSTFDLRYLLLSVVIFALALLGSYLYRRYYRP